MSNIKKDAEVLARMEAADDDGSLRLPNSKMPAPGTPYRYVIDEMWQRYENAGRVREFADAVQDARYERDNPPETPLFTLRTVAVMLVITIVLAGVLAALVGHAQF